MIKLWHKVIASIVGVTALGVMAIDASVQTKTEVTNIITVQQEQCLKNTGKYCQFKEGKINKDMFGTKIKKHDYEIRIDTWEGGAGDLRDKKGFKIRYIAPVITIPFINSTSTTI